MPLLLWGALAAVAATVLRQFWLGLGAPWRWPMLIVGCERAGLHRVVQLIRVVARKQWNRHRGVDPEPDPFEVLVMQQRLGALARELQLLESDGADQLYWARAHRLHARRCAYDQLLEQACKLAGVPAARTSSERPAFSEDGIVLRATVGHRSQEEWFRDEMELTSRGWNW